MVLISAILPLGTMWTKGVRNSDCLLLYMYTAGIHMQIIETGVRNQWKGVPGGVLQSWSVKKKVKGQL